MFKLSLFLFCLLLLFFIHFFLFYERGGGGGVEVVQDKVLLKKGKHKHFTHKIMFSNMGVFFLSGSMVQKVYYDEENIRCMLGILGNVVLELHFRGCLWRFKFISEYLRFCGVCNVRSGENK